jgi:hypothetical protein
VKLDCKKNHARIPTPDCQTAYEFGKVARFAGPPKHASKEEISIRADDEQLEAFGITDLPGQPHNDVKEELQYDKFEVQDVKAELQEVKEEPFQHEMAKQKKKTRRNPRSRSRYNQAVRRHSSPNAESSW